MAKELECPACQVKVEVLGKKNPVDCPNCKTKFNVVTRRVPLGRMEGIPEADLERLFYEFGRAGQFYIERLAERVSRLTLISDEGICSACQEEKKLTIEEKIPGKKYCSKCGGEYVFGKIARKEIVPEGKNFEIPLEVFIDNAFTIAQSIVARWWEKKLAKDTTKKPD